jgi:hypothetical protein
VDNGTLHDELRDIRTQLTDLTARIAVLESTQALAWKWGVGVASAVAAAVAITETVWRLLR